MSNRTTPTVIDELQEKALATKNRSLSDFRAELESIDELLGRSPDDAALLVQRARQKLLWYAYQTQDLGRVPTTDSIQELEEIATSETLPVDVTTWARAYYIIGRRNENGSMDVGQLVFELAQLAAKAGGHSVARHLFELTVINSRRRTPEQGIIALLKEILDAFKALMPSEETTTLECMMLDTKGAFGEWDEMSEELARLEAMPSLTTWARMGLLSAKVGWAAHQRAMELARQCRIELLDIAKDYGSRVLLVQRLYERANSLRGTGDEAEAMHLAEQGLDLARQIKTIRWTSVILMFLSGKYSTLGHIELALEFAKEAVDLSLQQKDYDMAVSCLVSTGREYSRLGDIDNAIRSFNKAVELIPLMPYPHGQLTTILIYKGWALNRVGQYAEAVQSLNEALHRTQEEALSLPKWAQFKTPMNSSNAHLGLGQAYQHLQEYEKAVENFQKGLEYAHNAGEVNVFTIEAMRDLASCLIACGEYERAARLFQEQDSLATEHMGMRLQTEMLRHEVERNVRQERDRAERERTLLESILPRSVATRRMAGERRIADTLENVTILFMDIVGFTPLASEFTAHQLVDFLDETFTRVDAIIEKHGGEKIKTIGDAYMAACNATRKVENGPERMAEAALEIIDTFGDQFRVGLHIGQVVGGILGKNRFTYDLWGDAVNIAARMEHHGMPGMVHATGVFVNALHDKQGLSFTERPNVKIKGKGTMTTFWIKRANDE